MHSFSSTEVAKNLSNIWTLVSRVSALKLAIRQTYRTNIQWQGLSHSGVIDINNRALTFIIHLIAYNRIGDWQHLDAKKHLDSV